MKFQNLVKNSHGQYEAVESPKLLPQGCLQGLALGRALLPTGEVDMEASRSAARETAPIQWGKGEKRESRCRPEREGLAELLGTGDTWLARSSLITTQSSARYYVFSQ